MPSVVPTMRAHLAYLVPACALLSYGGTTVQLDLALLLVLTLSVLAFGPTRMMGPTRLRAVAWALFLLPALHLLVPCSIFRREAWCSPPGDIVSTIPGWMTHSLDPGNTWVYVVQGCAILLSIHLGLGLVERGMRTKLAKGCATAASLVVLVSLFHELAGLEKLLGFYEPTHNKRVLGPVLNANHFGAVAAAGVLLSFGLATDQRQMRYRPLWLTLAMLNMLAVGWSASRAAAGGLVIGGLVFAAHYLRKAKRGTAAPRRLGAFVLGGTFISVVAAYLSPLGKAFVEEDLSKFELFRQSFGAVLDNPLLGGGRGAFSVVHTALWDGERAYFPENLLIQWSADWGVPIAAALLFTIASVIVDATKHSTGSLRIGGVSALVSLLAHDMFDFALEMTGIAVFASLTICIAVGSRRTKESPGVAYRSHWVMVAGAVAVLALAVGGFIGERAEAIVVASAHHTDAEPSDWRRLVSRHPNDPGILLVASRIAEREASMGVAARLLNRAMVRAPEWSGPHLQAARLLTRAGKTSQAMLELRRAEELRAGSAHHVLCGLAKRDELPTSLVRQALPKDGRARVLALSRLWLCLPAKDELSVEIHDELASARPTDLPASALRKLAQRALEEDKVREARELLQVATVQAPEDAIGWMLLARSHGNEGDYEQAQAVLRRANGLVARPEKLFFEQARLHAANGDMAAARKAVQSVRTLPSSRRSDRAAAMRLLAQLEASAGNLHLAIHAYRSAHRFGQTQALREASAMAKRAGRSLIAERLRNEHCGKIPSDKWCTEGAH